MMGQLITIDKRFEKSINLFFDMGKKEKINSYISTSSSEQIINQYMESLKSGNKERVSMLIGPYGKGKSHLLLVLLDRLEHMEKPYLPVLISYGQQDLKEEFLMGLQRALHRAGIEDIKPSSYYGEAVRQIMLWEEKYKATYMRMEKLLSSYKMSAKGLIRDLNQYSDKALKIFCKIYPELTSGSIFEPLVRTDLKENIVSMNRQLAKRYGYSGIFVVFDEFGKYIEGHSLKGYENDMKVLQDMCELAVKMEEPQFHLTMVTHKSIKEYGDTVDKRIMDGFMGIEGRIREIYYIDSVQNHYEMIDSVIKKDERQFQNRIAGKEDSDYRYIISESYKLPFFKSIFSKQEFEKIVGVGCYPLTPVASYLLLNISWKIAQNERTIFTFLAGQDVNGLANLIHIYGEEKYFGGEVIYDYFENIFREEVNNIQIHGEWLKADYALSRTDQKIEQDFIKNLALLHMVHKENEMPVTESNIALAMGIRQQKCRQIKDALVEKKLIVYREKTKICRLKNSVGVDVEEEIKRIRATSRVIYSTVLDKISEMQYELPKRYNFQYRMTRFFAYEFFHQGELLNLKTFEYLFEEKFSDGKIILLLEHAKGGDIKKLLEKLQDERVIIVNPENDFEGQALIEKYAAIERLKQDEEFISDNKAVLTELELYQHDIYFEVNTMLESNYLIENGKCEIYCLHDTDKVKSRQEFNRLLSDICDSYYHKAPKVNHELINRNYLSAQVRKARSNLLAGILQNQDMSAYLKGTSAEATIYRAALVRASKDSGILQMVEMIQQFVYSSAGKMQGFNKLYQGLQGKDFGIRKGIIPLYIAEVLAGLTDLPVIYCQGKEVEISTEILDNIDKTPADYSLYVEQATVEKEKYLQALKELYHVEREENNLNSIVEGMLRWYRGLPRYSCSYRVGLSRGQIRFRELFRGQDKNPRELLFKHLPDVFGTKSFTELFSQIKSAKEMIDAHMESVYIETGHAVREVLGGADKDDIHNLLKQWSRKQKDYVENHVCSSEFLRLYKFAEQIDGYEDKRILSDLSKVVTDTFLENWGEDSLNIFIDKLKAIFEETAKAQETENNRKVRFIASDGEVIEKAYSEVDQDGTGIFLQNAIEDALEEFDGSLDNTQKVAILIQTLEKVIKNG